VAGTTRRQGQLVTNRAMRRPSSARLGSDSQPRAAPPVGTTPRSTNSPECAPADRWPTSAGTEAEERLDSESEAPPAHPPRIIRGG
jgi:hypothetical protein